MNYKDKHNIKIEDGHTILFSHEDKVEPSGFSKYATPVRLCYWSNIESRYIPFSENFKEDIVSECEVIRLVEPKD